MDSMLALINIGWMEILLIVLFITGIIVIPIPGRYMRRRKRKPVVWSEKFLAAPIEKIHEVAEAFFCSYDQGEYELVGRQRFRLTFHRGPEVGGPDEQIVLSMRGEPPLADVPVVLQVLLQPRAGSLLISLRHEVHQGTAMSGKRRKRLSRLFGQELRAFREYLRSHFGEPRTPTLESSRPVKRIDATRRG